MLVLGRTAILVLIQQNSFFPTLHITTPDIGTNDRAKRVQKNTLPLSPGQPLKYAYLEENTSKYRMQETIEE